MKDNREVIKLVPLITQLGISMMVPIFLCVVAGIWIDNRFGTYFIIPLIILGMLAGYRNCYLILKKYLKDDEDDEL
ncbi:MAG: AtpZ/AtpI family protein [Lachnospiraceae bacterium]|nr:AtpZ/AtpI family protein [Lachnospira sp.]MBR6696689.1 AtpZ/AtpI family protein [Lachnospiraceae bacterium]